ncbi:unnamed protein product, partial [Meganyctiphanes norvegica]
MTTSIASMKFTIFLALVMSCRAAYYDVKGEDFAGYVAGSSFAVRPYAEISRYGVPVPPSGVDSAGVYLLDLTFYTQTQTIRRSSSGDAIFEYVYYCDNSDSELEIRLSYPWQSEFIKVCGPGSNGVSGQWSTGYFTRKCSASSCAAIDIWLYGVSLAESDVVGLDMLTLATDGDNFPRPTTAAPSTAPPTTAAPTTAAPTTAPPTTTFKTTSYETTYKTSAPPTEVPTTHEPTDKTTGDYTDDITSDYTDVSYYTDETTDDYTDDGNYTDVSYFTDDATDYYDYDDDDNELNL